MSFVEEMFKRMDLESVCAFLLYGSENLINENDSYKNRLENGRKAILKKLKSTCKDENDYEEAISDLSEALAAYESVYTEIGMKFGARMLHQLLYVDDYSDINKAK